MSRAAIEGTLTQALRTDNDAVRCPRAACVPHCQRILRPYNGLAVCTLAAFVRILPGHPLVVAANRDEFLDRPSSPPVVLAVGPRVVGGRDLRAGGTWLGVNEHGVVAGVLNRRSATPPDPARRSRGLLCLEVLRHRRAADAAAALTRVDPREYNPFNLFVADRAEAFLACAAAQATTVSTLFPGLHLLTNLDVDDPRCPRIAASYQRFAAAGERYCRERSRERLLAELQAVLADHSCGLDPRGEDPFASLCIHVEGYGTRSATVIFLPAAGPPLHYFADGPPCSAPLVAVEVGP